MKKLQLFLLGVIGLVNAYAQKLPNIQQTSLRAPANIKIDGNLNEWDGKFEAHNSGSRVFYTLSNDGSNLYLTLQTDDSQSTEKALEGGITFTIAPTNSKAKPIEVTFHANPNKDMLEVLPFLVYKYRDLPKDPVLNKRRIDSVAGVAHNLIKKNFKQVLVNGVPGVDEPLLSIYNTQGILVAAKLDNRLKYVYELALPLKLLSTVITPGGLSKYKIRVNVHGVIKTPGQFAPPMPKTDNIDNLYGNNDTDFRGEYTSAK